MDHVTSTVTEATTSVRPPVRDRVGWQRPALLVIAALAAALYAWNIRTSGYPAFYSMTVRSMASSWKAFVYGAVDPQASLTIDKLAGSFVPQAISVRIFGFHQWSLALPQVIEGVVATLVIHRVVRRWTGSVNAGLLAAAVLAFTPIVASMFEHSMEDGALTMCLVLAADRYQYAVLHGKLRSLVFCGVWVGAAFQTKMMVAWLILPALALAYLLAAPGSRGRRVRDVAVAGAVTLLASLSWVLLYMLTPSGDRPYIDGTTNNNAFTMVFGYNGLTRLGVQVPGALGGESAQKLKAALTQIGVPKSALPSMQSLGTDGWGKLFESKFGPEVGWLYPLVFIALVAGLWWTRRAPRTDPLRGGFVFWGIWLVTGLAVYSAMAIPHPAYLSFLAPPIAALSAAGIGLYWRTWLLPVALVAETAWTVFLAHYYRDFLPWLTPAVIALACLSFIALFLRSKKIMATIGVIAMLATPFAWAASTLDSQYSGSAIDATAGPVAFGVSAGGSGGLAQASQQQATYQVKHGGELNSVQRAILGYVRAGADPQAKYLFATDDWLTAQFYIESVAAHVLPMGGFSSHATYPTLEQVQALVRAGQLRYFLLDTPRTFSLSVLFGSVGGGPTMHSVDAWVREDCVAIPSIAYGVPAKDAAQELYRCST